MPPRCRCRSGKSYKRCCQPFHEGRALPPDPERLMRARYCAYARGLVEFVADTTEPTGPHYNPDRPQWLAELRAFCGQTRFLGLRVLESHVRGQEGLVAFRAELEQRGQDASFAERSRFRWADGVWRYVDGERG